MPTYQYRCVDCSHTFEAIQKMKDKPIEICPICKGKTVRIISGGAGFLLKGSGFYATDYPSSSYKKGAAAEKNQPAAVAKDAPVAKETGAKKEPQGKDS
jgi:putative FmdB family regulatory protein